MRLSFLFLLVPTGSLKLKTANYFSKSYAANDCQTYRMLILQPSIEGFHSEEHSKTSIGSRRMSSYMMPSSLFILYKVNKVHVENVGK